MKLYYFLILVIKQLAEFLCLVLSCRVYLVYSYPKVRRNTSQTLSIRQWVWQRNRVEEECCTERQGGGQKREKVELKKRNWSCLVMEPHFW